MTEPQSAHDIRFDMTLTAPIPYFGGKRKIAQKVWAYLGDVKTYIEPFFGSGAVLLMRPRTRHEKIYELINDIDGNIANMWRALQFDIDEVEKWCDWPVNHIDLIARRKVIIESYDQLKNNLVADPEFYDAKLAGYYLWAASCWLGCGLMTKKAIPVLSGDHGIEQYRSMGKIPGITSDSGIIAKQDTMKEYLLKIQQRIKKIKVVCGEWHQVCGGKWQENNGVVGIYFDPPYSSEDRCKDVYKYDSLDVGKAVEKWALERGNNPAYRIVISGYEGDYKNLIGSGWKVEAWVAWGGFSNMAIKKKRIKENRTLERIYISPYCINIAEEQASLWVVEN